MTGFLKYQHVERWNHQECDGLLEGICHVFYKLDGTNASVWMDAPGGGICAGSRNRQLSLDNDNAGFYRWWLDQPKAWNFHHNNPHLRLYGEWLVPHSLKTYKDEAWRRFYVFDIWDSQKESLLSYEAYRPLCEEFGLDYIPEMCVIRNPSEDDLHRMLEKTGQFLIKDGHGMGEGFVIKNYDFYNKYGRQVWGKMVSNEFKVLNHLEMGAPVINGTALVEEQIVDNFCTEAFIEKEKAKIINKNWSSKVDLETGEITNILPHWDNKLIPELLGRVWYEFLREETSEWVKKYKNPKVNFQLLQRLVQSKTKKVIGL